MPQVNLSNSLVFFCRLLCSCHIQTHAETYAPFLGLDEDGGAKAVRERVKEYCLREVEPLEKEVEELEVTALAEALGVGIRIQHMDVSGGNINHHDVPEGVEPLVNMLYRPGHYDLIYPK